LSIQKEQNLSSKETLLKIKIFPYWFSYWLDHFFVITNAAALKKLV